MKFYLILFVIFMTGCSVKPNLDSISIPDVDIEKDESMYFKFNDKHIHVKVKNKTNLPGIHHDVDENNFLPLPFVDYLQNNIIANLKKSPGLVLLDSPDSASYSIELNLNHFDVYRETDGGDAAALLLVGGLIGGALMKEECFAEIESDVNIIDNSTKNILCSFDISVKTSTEFNMNYVKKGYKDSTESAVSEFIVQLLNKLKGC